MVISFPAKNASPPAHGPSAGPSGPGRTDYPGLKSTDRAPREEIQHRAYAIWQSEGEPNDRQLAHWLQAEAEVMQHN